MLHSLPTDARYVFSIECIHAGRVFRTNVAATPIQLRQIRMGRGEWLEELLWRLDKEMLKALNDHDRAQVKAA